VNPYSTCRVGKDSPRVNPNGANDGSGLEGARFRGVAKLRFEWYRGVFLLLQQRSRHSREMVITPKAVVETRR